ncbi:MAG: hypothetical protein AB1324_00455 [Candidatus Micrarchaeota archaeon]
MSQAFSEVCRVRARHLPMPKKLKDLFSHYESSYYDIMTRLLEDKPEIEKVECAILKFRVFRKIFYSELVKHAHSPGAVTSLEDSNFAVDTVVEGRVKLLETFHGHADALCPAMDTPAAFLPFIKFYEDFLSDILGQTMKYDDGRQPMVFVKSGSGRELSTFMHESLHASVRGLPPAFEEGFCRHSLQVLGHDQDELGGLLAHDEEVIRANLAGIYYPNILVRMLSEAFGEKAVRDAFFKMDVSKIDARLGMHARTNLAALDLPYLSGSSAGASKSLAGLADSLASGLSAGVREIISRVDSIVSGNK